MDIGVWMASEVLAHKLERRPGENPEKTWSLRRWPSRLSEPGENRLFVASQGAWRGYFVLADEALYNANDPAAPFTLLFDARTWHPIPPVPVRPFRGFTYAVPDTPPQAREPTPVTGSE